MIDNDDMSIILPGRIVTYYPTDQTADIQISAERIFSNIDSLLQQTDRQLLLDVPVHTPYGGGWSVTFPIKTGDTCLLCFSQIGYDHWLYKDLDRGGTVERQPVPHLKRQFSEDDGFAMVGFNTKPRAIQSYHPTHSQWRDEDASQVISLNDDETITITSPVALTINAPSVVVNCETTVINASTSVTMDTPLVTFTGDFDVPNGTYTLTGIDMNNHIHSQGNDGNGDAEVDTTGPHN